MSAPDLHKHEKFRSRFLRNQRDLIVYLPPSYHEQPQRRFPVLYLHDGQNLFDGATSFIPGMDWHVGHTADDFILTGAVQPLIIVGIYNVGKLRIYEYTPTKAPRLGGGRADRYAKFLVREVMPFIQQEYRVLSDARVTGMGGSSLGGLVSLYLGLKHPNPARASGSTSARRKARASFTMSKNFATSFCETAGSSARTFITS